MAWYDFARRLGRKAATSTEDIIRELYGWRKSITGRAVNADTALQVSTVFACLRVIGNGMAQVPIKLMRVQEVGGKTRRLPARHHPLYDLIGARPNPWQTSWDFRQTMSWHVELGGNFIAFKNAPLGEVREIIPFDPGRVRVKREDDLTLRYFVRGDSGAEIEFPAEAILHVRGPSWNSWNGIQVIAAAREAVGLSMALEETQARLQKNGGRPLGGWSVDGKLNPEQYKDLRKWLDQEYAGIENAGKIAIMDRNAKWYTTQMSGVDSQLRESRRDQIEEVCRFFGVMPIMVGYSDKAATYASAEQMFLAHAVHCLSPRWSMYEQALDAQLLTDRERAEGYYFDFVEEGMIRGSAKDTKDTILGYVNGGVMTPNEGREKLDLNPDDDQASDRLRIPVNVAQETPGPDDTPEGNRQPAA